MLYPYQYALTIFVKSDVLIYLVQNNGQNKPYKIVWDIYAHEYKCYGWVFFEIGLNSAWKDCQMVRKITDSDSH